MNMLYSDYSKVVKAHGITSVDFPDRPGELVAPRFELMNDARHIRGMTVENIYGA